jgi:predicted GIY-YIG superfamily endonuclease
MSLVYKITNKENDLIYIGATKNLNRRIAGHKHQAFTKNSTMKIHNDMRLIGWDYFKFDIVEICEPKKLSEREEFYIKKYNSFWPFGYNTVCGKDRHDSLKDSYSRPVIILNLKNNKEIEFKSAKEASRYLKLSEGAVSRSIYIKSFLLNKYVIKYKDDSRSFNEIIEEIEIKKANDFLKVSIKRIGKTPHNIKKVKLTNFETKEELIFKSILEAAKFLKRQTTNISYACKKHGRIVGGHYAEYYKD